MYGLVHKDSPYPLIHWVTSSSRWWWTQNKDWFNLRGYGLAYGSCPLNILEERLWDNFDNLLKINYPLWNFPISLFITWIKTPMLSMYYLQILCLELSFIIIVLLLRGESLKNLMPTSFSQGGRAWRSTFRCCSPSL